MVAKEKPGFADGLITDEAIAEHRTRIGKKRRALPGRNNAASIDNIRQFVDAIGDCNPLYRSGEYASKSRYGGRVAPPSFIRSIAGTGMMHGLPGVLAFQNGASWLFHKPVFPGDRIVCEVEFIDLQDKTTRAGERWLHEIYEGKYVNQWDELVVTGYTTIARRERSGVSSATIGEEKKQPKIVQPHPWTDEERTRIEDEMVKSTEDIRGAEPRYWEDVSEGDELPQLVKGPLSITDMIAWLAVEQPLVGGGLAIRLFQRVPGLALLHPESNAREFIEIVHCGMKTAEIAGFPNAYDYGAQRHCFYMQQLTNWMGDDGWLKKCDAQFRGFVFISDVLRFNSKITKKYMDEDGEPCVDIVTETMSQRGDNNMPASATVVLPSQEKGTWPASNRVAHE
jgi:acyl dehydratase